MQEALRDQAFITYQGPARLYLNFEGLTPGYEGQTGLVSKDTYNFILFDTDTQVRLWEDANGDGYSSADELISLDELGIQSINTSSTNSTHIDPQGNEHRITGSFTKTDGTIRDIADVWFKNRP